MKHRYFIFLVLFWSFGSLYSQIQAVDAHVPPLGFNLLEKERLNNEKRQKDSFQEVVDKVLDQHQSVPQKKIVAPVVSNLELPQEKISPALVYLLSAQYQEEPLQSIKLAYHFSQLSIHDALAVITKITGIPFVVDAEVTGFIKDLVIPECSLGAGLHILLSNNSPRLALVKQYDTFRIMTEQSARAICSYKAQELEQASYVSSHYTVLRAKWDDTFKKQSELLWAGITKNEVRDKELFFSLDDANKKIFFRGKEQHVKFFKEAMASLDQPIPQVRIDIRVIIANKSFEDSFGVEWSGIYDRQASIKHFDFIGVGPLIQEGNPLFDYFKKLITWTVNILPPASSSLPTASIPFVFSNNNENSPKRLNLLLNASENKNLIKTILKPSILACSNEPAEILVGEELPQETRIDEAIEGKLTNVTATYYKDIGMKIKVHPVVFPEKKEVFLDIYIENSSVVPRHIDHQRNTRGLLNYTIETTRSKSKTVLRSGQTTMIGGLMTQVREKVTVGIPWLQDIPLFGLLFRGKRNKLVDKQLIIFITPTIV